jgi:glycosyltransferase involved in cell wall biosynthesis
VKVLFVHNAYQHKGGEDSVLEAEGSLLSNRGHAVEYFTRHNDEISQLSRVSVAMQTFWSSPVARDFEARLRSFKPDVVHVHNTFPRISPAIYWVAAKLGVPIVQTLHNFRLMCPQAMFLREGKVCEDCLGKLPWRGAARLLPGLQVTKHSSGEHGVTPSRSGNLAEQGDPLHRLE